MHGKTQNANESFNGTIWERIPKNTFVTLPNLEFGVYDGVAHCNIRMKASVLIYEKLNFIPLVCMPKGFKKHNLKRVNFGNKRASRKNKRRDRRQKTFEFLSRLCRTNGGRGQDKSAKSCQFPDKSLLFQIALTAS